MSVEIKITPAVIVPGTALGPPEKTGAQNIFDRLIAVRGRFAETVARLEAVKRSIDSAAPSARLSPEFGQSQKPRSFFEGLEMITDDPEALAAVLDAGVEGLSGMF